MTPRHPQWKPRYVKWEDEIILDKLEDVDKNDHWQIMKRCQRISDNYLPHRSADGIKARWFLLIGKISYRKDWKGPLRSLDDLIPEMSEPTQRKVKVLIRCPRSS